MAKMKFYGKSIILVNAKRSVTFAFCRTDQKIFWKSNLGYQILSSCFPNNRYFLQYFLGIKILYDFVYFLYWCSGVLKCHLVYSKKHSGFLEYTKCPFDN